VGAARTVISTSWPERRGLAHHPRRRPILKPTLDY
jgi:hypothetical protein